LLQPLDRTHVGPPVAHEVVPREDDQKLEAAPQSCADLNCRIAALAAATNCDPEALDRFLSVLAACDIFEQIAFANLEHTLRTERPAIETVAPDGLFAYLRSHPQEAGLFDTTMTSMTTSDNDNIVGAYDFSQSEIIADIGGGQGASLGQILRRTPNVQSILFDLPDVVAGAPAMERMQILQGDFLRDPLPPADLYVLAAVRRAAPGWEVVGD
jgi:hypothetical protein